MLVTFILADVVAEAVTLLCFGTAECAVSDIHSASHVGEDSTTFSGNAGVKDSVSHVWSHAAQPTRTCPA